ncbi:hypothetical protein Hanom_Chr06g00499921 [Helianthus anomalus]
MPDKHIGRMPAVIPAAITCKHIQPPSLFSLSTRARSLSGEHLILQDNYTVKISIILKIRMVLG